VYDHGNVVGLVSGHAQTPHAKVLGNLSASFDAVKGFSDVRLGGRAEIKCTLVNGVNTLVRVKPKS
jgi:hypothetical protein